MTRLKKNIPDNPNFNVLTFLKKEKTRKKSLNLNLFDLFIVSKKDETK